jgi:hypothetical protein
LVIGGSGMKWIYTGYINVALDYTFSEVCNPYVKFDERSDDQLALMGGITDAV